MINQRQPPTPQKTVKAARNEVQLLVFIVFLIRYGSVFKTEEEKLRLGMDSLQFCHKSKRQNNLIDLRKQSGCKLAPNDLQCLLLNDLNSS